MICDKHTKRSLLFGVKNFFFFGWILINIEDINKIRMLGPKEEPKSLKLVGINIFIKNKFSLL